MRRTEGKGQAGTSVRAFAGLPLPWSLSSRFLPPLHRWSHPQLSSGVGRAPLPASLRHQAERLQGLPRTQHREGEVADVPQDQEGSAPSHHVFKA